MIEPTQAEIAKYEYEEHVVEVRLDTQCDTVWLAQAQMVSLFGRNQSVISRHIRKAFKEKELDRKSTMQKIHIANSDKPVEFYNLDLFISVGYRVKSPQATRFRQWESVADIERLVV